MQALDKDIVESARKALDGYFDAINAERVQEIKDRWFHFPHVRFHSGKISVMQTPDDFWSPALRRQGQTAEWGYTKWDYQEPIDAGPEKVHFRVQFSRYRKDGSLLGSYKSLYIVTFLNGRWAIQGRSSWAE